MAISDVLLEGRLTFKTYLNKKRGGEGLKSEDFRGDVIYGWLPTVYTIKLMFEELRRELLKFYYFWDFIKIYFLCGSLSSLNGFSFSKKV